MHSQIHGRSRRRPPEIPWVAVATIIGIVVVVVMALVYFSGTGGTAASGSAGSSSGSSAAAATTTQSSSSSGSDTTTIVKTATTPVTVSGSGVSIKVEYLGSFSGSYTANGETTTVKNSGTRVYEIDSASGTVTATFKKGDSSTSHALTVSIYNNGNLVATQSTSDANGSVTVSATV
ncbi:MAG: hypothetical protein WC342_01565 [Methanoregula sp.]|jgi:uncharacterized protein (UPF0333 family)